jgi:hypothetical protein
MVWVTVLSLLCGEAVGSVDAPHRSQFNFLAGLATTVFGVVAVV